MNRLFALLRVIFDRLLRRQRAAVPRPAPIAAVYAAGLVPPPEEPEPAPEPRPNRGARRTAAKMDKLKRRYERQRMKFDKFVEPRGPQPTPIARTSTADAEAAEPLAPPTDEEMNAKGWVPPICVDLHHSDRKTDVLYDMREFKGEFRFRDTIIDQLPRYFVYLDRMKKHSPDAYGLYRMLGATLLPYAAITDLWLDRKTGKYWAQDRETGYEKHAKLSPWFLKTRPAFACVAYGTNPEAERREDECFAETKRYISVPRFMYFYKYKNPPPSVQAMSGGDVYCMTIWWDRAQDRRRKYGQPSDYAVFVGQDGSLRALRMLEASKLKVRCKQRTANDKRGQTFSIPQRAWRIPAVYKSWAEQYHTTAEKLLTGMFADLAAHVEDGAHTMAKVSVSSKTGSYAVFGIDVERLPYFFQDRDYQLNERGHRKRILHAVRPHQRADGTWAKLQFRGQKDFTWAGYNVRVTIPGLDHIPAEEFDLGCTADYWVPRDQANQYISGEKAGKKLRRMLYGEGNT